MKSSDSFLRIKNGESVEWTLIPEYEPTELISVLGIELDRGSRLCSFFGLEEADKTRLIAVVASDVDHCLGIVRSIPFSGTYPSLTLRHPQAHMFEREIWEQYGLIPEGHPWLKPVRQAAGTAPKPGDFFEVEGGEIHEVAVGPIHAGVIEPGHFRFQCKGEEVLHLEIALGYQHRGIEEALPGGPHLSTVYQIETIAGDSSVAHTTAYAQLLEGLAGVDVPAPIQWIRAIGLELERLANHTGDLGALAGDVAFLPTSSACGKLRGDLLNLTAQICGNRFGRGLVRPGAGVSSLSEVQLRVIREGLDKTMREVDRAIQWLWESPSTRIRFEGVGVIDPDRALELGLQGPAMRACSHPRDIRVDQPFGWYRSAPIPVSVWKGGDVFARARVRGLELAHSETYLREQLKEAPKEKGGNVDLHPRPNHLAVSLVEAWRGGVCHVALTDAQGTFRRYKITDPSFNNWMGLALSLRGEEISDFPICNKSFNLSYCGVDL